jgi:phosphoserine phosphatase RsbU/P
VIIERAWVLSDGRSGRHGACRDPFSHLRHPIGVTDSGLACGEVRGGNRPVHVDVQLPGLRGVLYSSVCDGARGGDIHYLSVCGSGLLARLCVADVPGHGDAVAAVGTEMYGQLRRSVDIVDERRVLRAIDRRIARAGVFAMTTAVLATYYPPGRRLALSYAGHPPAWFRSAADGVWRPIEPQAPQSTSGPPVGLPLGTGLSPVFTRRRLKVAEGDRLLLLTDGVLEAASPTGEELGHAGLQRLLDSHEDDHEGLVDHLLAGLADHTGSPVFAHDDVTMFVCEIVAGPAGPALWHVFKNRLNFGAPQVVGDIRPVQSTAPAA